MAGMLNDSLIDEQKAMIAHQKRNEEFLKSQIASL